MHSVSLSQLWELTSGLEHAYAYLCSFSSTPLQSRRIGMYVDGLFSSNNSPAPIKGALRYPTISDSFRRGFQPWRQYLAHHGHYILYTHFTTSTCHRRPEQVYIVSFASDNA